MADAESRDLSVVHFADESDEGDVLESATEGQTVTFETGSFSAYAVVQGPSEIPAGWAKLTSMADLAGKMADGVYIGHTSGLYLSDTESIATNGAHGITKTRPARSFPTADAGRYYFEPAEGDTNQYYLFCLKEGQKYYIENRSAEHIYLTENAENKTAFIVTDESNSRFSLQSTVTQRYLNNWQDANGIVFACWTAKNTGSYFYLWSHDDEGAGDPYGLDGTTYGLMNWTDGPSGRAMMAEAAAPGSLKALSLTVMTKKGNNNDKLFVPDDSDISQWSFQWTGMGELYYVKTIVDGNTHYLRIGPDGRLSLTGEPDDNCRIQVAPGTGTHAGEIYLKCGNKTLTYSGQINNGFSTGGSAGMEWLKLVEISELTSDYFLTYSASKVSVSDERVTNGSRIIVYTRVWNDTTKKYEFYAIDHDGSLVRCYESGDDIQWVGARLNSMLWNLVEYYWEGTTDPNDYYELYNQYSEKFIAPRLTGGQILSDETIGINMNGRKNGQYYTEIVAWDDPNYAYVGLKADLNSGKVVACTREEADDFFFAVMQDIPVDDTLHTVETVDSVQHGITMKLVDFNSRQAMSDFLGSDAGGAVNNSDPDLLSCGLGENGYPTTKAGNNLAAWFEGSREVNHLFIQSTYSATGYFEYDSSQNFASLQGNDFVVYKELGTVNGGGGAHYQHGQFFPYNDLEAGVFSSTNPKNLTTAGGAALPEADPRKYEQLYLVRNQNYYIGMEVNAAFTQTPDGKDDWGHDIIYEFTGDDDFWLYVDSELIIDLGGIHNALSGSVNYKTGEVYVNGVRHTLRELFESNYRKRNPGATPAQVAEYLALFFDEGSTIFRDYTTHTMKIFYLERGAGASNLHMRFNLASIKPGTVELSKNLNGVDSTESILAEFPYQIKYKRAGDETEYYLSNAIPDDPERNTNYVFYKNTVNPVPFRKELKVDNVLYRDVFLLKPGETAVISFPTFGEEGETIASYDIVECGVNTNVFHSVSANGVALEGTNGAGTGVYADSRKDFATGYALMAERARIVYTNTVNPDAIRTLTIRKKLYDEFGESELPNDSTAFSFRLYLRTDSEGEPEAASMHTYHVRDSSGCYCRWNAGTQKFESTGKDNYADLTPEEKNDCRFTTSINGTISKISAGYTVEVRDVLAGTKFRVVERPTEIPDGYSFQRYEYYPKGLEDTEPPTVGTDALKGVSDTTVVKQNPHVDIRNLKGWGLRVNKIWRDKDYMSTRDSTYFAVYAKKNGLELVQNTVQRIPYSAAPQTLYWYFEHLPVDGTSGVDDYVIREVTISAENTTANEDGIITEPGTVTMIPEGGQIILNGTQKGETGLSSFTYTVFYEEGAVSQESNVRVDTVTNDRPGIVLRKENWNGGALAGATFALTEGEGNLIGTFTSNTEGLITTAFLSEGKMYTLAETKTPRAWQGLETPMTITWNNGIVAVDGVDEAYYDLTQANGSTLATLTIKNRPFILKAIKMDGDSGQPLQGVSFALHKQRTVDGITQFDPNPMDGYETLVTDEQGIIPGIDNTLPSGTYQLRENQAKQSYVRLSDYIHFTIGDTGRITLGTVPDGVTLSSEDSSSDETAECVIHIPNHQVADIVLKKEDDKGNALTGAKFQLCKFTTNWETVEAYREIDLTDASQTTLSGLKLGRYRLTETMAPDGYLITNRFVFFTITSDESGVLQITLTDEEGTGENSNPNASATDLTISVRNMPGVELPKSGGPGTALYTAAGGILLCLGAWLLLRRRKKENV